MLRSTRVHAALAAVVATLAAATLCACSSSASTASPPATSPGATSPGPSSSPADDVQVIKVGWANGKPVVPSDRIPIKLGSKVRLEVNSDVAEIVHVHLNDAEQDVTAGGTVVFTFTADKAGVFDVEMHKADKLVVQLQVS